VIFHITQNGERELTNPFAAQQDEWVLVMDQHQLCSPEATPSATNRRVMLPFRQRPRSWPWIDFTSHHATGVKLDLHREQLFIILVISLTTLGNNAKGESL